MQIAVVTGAGRGLGRLIATGLADKGYFVLATDIDSEAATATARALGDGRATAMAQDVRDPASHRQVAAAATRRGALALWVNNAGVLRTAKAWEHPDADVKLQIEVNVNGVVFGSRAAIDAMGTTGGHIINIASMSSIVPAPGLAIYGATKHAVLGFTLSLAGDLQQAELPIKVSAVCPDAIDTDMTRTVAGHKDAGILFSARAMLRPEDIAAKVIGLVDNPRLVISIPSSRAFMAHIVRPFPGVGLRILDQFRKLGERNRKRRGLT